MDSWKIMRAACLALTTLLSYPVLADYTRVTASPAVTIDNIYANEWGSPFVTFTGSVNTACADGGKGLYLYNLEISPGSEQLRGNKMSIALMALSTGSDVVLDYYFDSALSGWDACYIHGIKIVRE